MSRHYRIPTQIGDVKEMALNPGEVRPVPLAYVWSRIFAKPSTGSVGQWRYCDTPVNWYHIMRKSDNTLDVHSSAHAWNQGPNSKEKKDLA